MDRAKQDINWSAVAAESFEAKLIEVSRSMRQEKIEAGIRQLRQKSAASSRAPFPGVAEQRERFITEIIDQAEWREGKAAQYPHDHRNQRSAERLRQLAHELDAIAPSDELWIRYYRAFEQFGDDGSPFLEYESEARREYGFHEDIAPPTNKDAAQFLRGHVEGLERLAVESKFKEE